jgi:hypothetical protein
MRRTYNKRLKKVSMLIDAMPIAPAAEERAFDRFRRTGELPEHQRLAKAVIERALRGGADCGSPMAYDFKAAMECLERAAERLKEAEAEPEPLRKTLFHEAVYGPKFVSIPARFALRILVDMGRDVTDPEFIPTDTEIPDWGSVGWHLIGLPERIVKPPYEDQAQRLFDRFASLRERIDRDNKEWFEELAEAGVRFLHEGELPHDELLCEAVLANGEFMGLLQHHVGHGDAEVMAAFDQVARAQGEARAAAIGRVQAMAAEGRLVSRGG